MKNATLLFCFLALAVSAIGQEVVIPLNNPSFEGLPHKGQAHVKGQPSIGIPGWFDCGQIKFKRETAPDLHPINAWKVNRGPSDGNTYLGMVVRSTDSWESVSQQLSTPLEAGKCYSFSLDLARSQFYVSGDRLTGFDENYTKAAVLKIYGGSEICGKHVMLGESITVTNEEWRTYEFEFRPDRDVSFITLEAFYKVPILFPYNGHVLVDNASDIRQIPCDEESAPTEIDIVTETPAPTNTPRTPTRTTPTPVTEQLDVQDLVEPVTVAETNPEDTKPAKKLIPGLQRNSYRKNQIIRINSIYFEMNSEDFDQASLDAIDQIYEFLIKNENLVIEVGGHTNTIPPKEYCDELSSKRAKAVASMLAKKGIPTERLYYMGYGKRKPIIPNEGNNMKARKTNQRVEIKILKTDYQG